MVHRAATLLILAFIAFNALSPVSSASSVLRRGATGPEVRQLQQLLNQWLIATSQTGLQSLVVDGIFGPQTERSVRAYQRTMGLRVDGIVGPLTWASLLAAPAGRPPTRRATAPSAPKPPTPTIAPTATRISTRPSPTASSIVRTGSCADIPPPTNIAATDPNPLCLRGNGAIQLYLKGFAKEQQYRYYIAMPEGSMRGRPRIGHIGVGPIGNGLVVMASGTEFGIVLEPGDYVLVVEGLPNAQPRATAPFRILP